MWKRRCVRRAAGATTEQAHGPVVTFEPPSFLREFRMLSQEYSDWAQCPFYVILYLPGQPYIHLPSVGYPLPSQVTH